MLAAGCLLDLPQFRVGARHCAFQTADRHPDNDFSGALALENVHCDTEYRLLKKAIHLLEDAAEGPIMQTLPLLSVLKSTSRCVTLSDYNQPNNPIVFANAAFTRLTGYQSLEVVGKSCRLLQGPDTDRAAVADIRHAISCGSSIRRVILNYRKDGTAFWNDFTIDPLFDKANRLLGFIGIQDDISGSRARLDEQTASAGHLRRIINNVPGYAFRRL